MLMVKASPKPSQIHGLGLFADEKILKGTTIWKYDPRFDISYDPTAVEHFPPSQREYIKRHSYLSKTMGKYIYSIDDSHFTNHSANNSNQTIVQFPGEPDTCGVASRDIEIGEELLVDYRLFDAHDATNNDEYLKT